MLPSVNRCYFVDEPATCLCNGGTRVIVMQQRVCYYFDISDCILDWKMERLIWIGYYKGIYNGKKNRCLFSKLPKAIVTHVIKFIAFVKMDEKNRRHCMKLEI